jgi:hypothetical protein
MLEADGYLRQAAFNFRLADAHLKDAEEQLRKLAERLEDCAKIIKKIPIDEALLWEQVDTIIQENQPVGAAEPEPVNS